jgi:hypothetical protein
MRTVRPRWTHVEPTVNPRWTHVEPTLNPRRDGSRPTVCDVKLNYSYFKLFFSKSGCPKFFYDKFQMNEPAWYGWIVDYRFLRFFLSFQFWPYQDVTTITARPRSSHGQFFELRFTDSRMSFSENLVALSCSTTNFRWMSRRDMVELWIIGFFVLFEISVLIFSIWYQNHGSPTVIPRPIFWVAFYGQ